MILASIFERMEDEMSYSDMESIPERISVDSGRILKIEIMGRKKRDVLNAENMHVLRRTEENIYQCRLENLGKDTRTE